MPIDRDTQLRDTARSMRRAVWALALAGCAFDPSAWGNPQIREDIAANEPSQDAGIEDGSVRGHAAASGEAGSGAGPRQDDGRARRASASRDRNEIAQNPISAGAVGGAASRGGDEDAGEDDAGSELDASMARPDAEAPITADASLGSDAAAADAGSRDRPSPEDRSFALDMLGVVVSILQAHPEQDPGDLLQTLAGDVTPDAKLITEFLLFVEGAEDCDDRDEPCAPACTVVARRCDRCTPDRECADALNEACGRDRRCW